MNYTADLEAERTRKDEFFKNHPHSPIPYDQREGFRGLIYYEPNPGLRFVVPLHEHEEKAELLLDTSTEGVRQYLRWGEFRVEIDDEDVVIQAYRTDEHESRLFIPFRDRTSGNETYGAGRYLDLEGEDRDGDEWILDFNFAYNPYCAYSEAYECPLPPGENWLQVAVNAGEKSYEPN
ncbi:DUF1684 domain-containing protein [Haladaptatus sp. DJG-WS-42]|uniref:DUF1684 domain-containing protein n=1 Tax=Haladaptatus sp. DJG-WS-42 TaxID=3120516 RepID=UPI0030D0BB72